MKLISLYTYLDKVGGAENLCVNLHNSLMESEVFSEGKLSSFVAYKDLAPIYKKKISPDSYLEYRIRDLLRNSKNKIFLSHHRKTTTYLLGLSKLLRKDIKIVHIAHSTLTSLKYVSIFPKHTIAVSESVKKNHIEYFKLKNIKVIYNGVYRPKLVNRKAYNPENIVVTIVGSVQERKQQIRLANFLKDKLPKQVYIKFAGGGEDLNQLVEIIGDYKQFEALGHIDDMESIYQKSDFILLYSKAEGLPLCLIEAQSYAKPIICNDVGGNLEILNPGENGYFVASMQELLKCLESLPNIEASEYVEMQEHSLKNFYANFQYNNMLAEYEEVFKEIIKTRSTN